MILIVPTSSCVSFLKVWFIRILFFVLGIGAHEESKFQYNLELSLIQNLKLVDLEPNIYVHFSLFHYFTNEILYNQYN